MKLICWELLVAAFDFWGTTVRVTAGLFYRVGAETPLYIREKNLQERLLKKFSAVDTQTAVLVSTAEVWISAPDTQT